MQDEYVSVEHIFMCILDENPSTPIGRVNQVFKLDRDKFLSLLIEVRGHQKVTSDNPEATYEALKKIWKGFSRRGKTGKIGPSHWKG